MTQPITAPPQPELATAVPPAESKATNDEKSAFFTAADDAAIRPFEFHASDEELADLWRRIEATRWPDRETVADDTQGVQLATMQKLAAYWANEYDWRKCEAQLNALPNFITEIDGLDVHFIHVRSKHPNALPVIVTTAGRARWSSSSRSSGRSPIRRPMEAPQRTRSMS